MRLNARAQRRTARRSLRELALVFLKVGATGFGGAMAMLAMIHAQMVERRRWVSQEEFDEGVALGQILPGPIAVNAVAYMGYRQRGVPGAVISAGAFIRGVSPAVVGMILAAGIAIARASVVDMWTGLLAAACLVAWSASGSTRLQW